MTVMLPKRQASAHCCLHQGPGIPLAPEDASECCTLRRAGNYCVGGEVISRAVFCSRLPSKSHRLFHYHNYLRGPCSTQAAIGIYSVVWDRGTALEGLAGVRGLGLTRSLRINK